MTAAGRGIRNAFRNAVRTISVVLILGLAIGLSVVMLIAHHSVTGKIATTFSSIGNTVTIGPSGYPADGQPAKNLTTAELAPIANLHGKTLTVAAIFDSDNQAGNDTVVTSLPVLQRLTGKTGQVSTAVVTVASLTQLAAVTSAIERTLGPLAAVTSNLANASQAIGDLDSVKGIALYSLAGAVGAAVVILFLVMVMIVRERKPEIGILKAIGASNGRIMAQFTTEALTFTLLGWVVGLVAGIVAGSAVTSALVSHSGASSDAAGAGPSGAPSPFLSHLTDINAQVGWGVILYGLAAAVVIAILASAATTWMIARISPAEALRTE